MALPSPNLSALVIGAGSIGRRHLRNLQQLGVRQVAACDPDSERREWVIREAGAGAFADPAEALTALKPAVVLVCTPPASHVELARQAVVAGAHVFVEKPLSSSLDGIEELAREAESAGRAVGVGYNLRFHPGLQRVKSLIDEGAIGRPLWARAEVGQYLPDWRPWQDYRKGYTASAGLGGGIILDASHEIDYVMWLMGRPGSVTAVAGNVSDLEMDAEDCATILMRFAGGAQADVHLDCVQRAYARNLKVAGALGTVEWDYPSSLVRLYRAEPAAWEEFPYTFEANDMYLAELRAFLESVESGVPPPVGIEEGAAVVRVALAARSTAANGRTESLGW